MLCKHVPSGFFVTEFGDKNARISHKILYNYHVRKMAQGILNSELPFDL